MLFQLYSWRKRSLCKALLKRLSDNIIQILTFEHFWRNWTEVFNSFFKSNFRQPPAFINYDNTQYPLGGRNYGIQFYQRLKKAFQTLSFLKFKSKENFFLMTMRCIVSRSKKLTRSNSFILLLKVLGDKV